MKNLQTVPTSISDHHYLTACIGDKVGDYKPREYKVRNNGLLTEEALKLAVELNEKLHKIFHHLDSNKIAQILMEELNLIIETIAPSRIAQSKNKN